jgi:hypothetical protein
MKLTNRANLPDAIFQAVANDPYSRGDADISVTGLISPPRKVALESAHADELSEDAADRIWSLLGQSIHTILERANRVGIAERRLSITVDGWKISGGMDLYEEDGVLVDYKTTSAWSCKGGVKPEWETQLNVYAEILRANGHPVKGLRIVAILRDWSKLEARREFTYPQAQVLSFDVPLWDAVRAQAFIRERVILHKQARVSLPECTPEERWARPGKFALMKVGGKRAVKLYDTEAEARAHASVDPKNLRVEARPGEAVRCSAYCGAAAFCAQYQNESKQPASQAQTEERETA